MRKNNLEESKNYAKYRTLSILPLESIAEFENTILPDPVDGAHIQVSLTISFEEAASGTEKVLDIVVGGQKKRILVKVPAGIKNGTPMRYQGKGERGKYGGTDGNLYVNVYVLPPIKEKSKEEDSVVTQTINLTFMEAVRGTKKEVKILLDSKEAGKTKESRILSVKIPAGIDNGQKLRVKVDQEQVILFDIHVESHPKFYRKEYDIYSTEKLPSYIGSGRVVGIETLDGKHYYAVTKNLQDGSQICLRNKGIPQLKNPAERGDHYVIWRREE